MKINVIDNQVIDNQDSAFPTVVRLDNDDLICGFCRGGGPEVTGGSHWARSKDNGNSWQYEGVILPPVEADGERLVNTLRLSKNNNGCIVAYGQRNHISNSTKFGTLKNEGVFCISNPLGKNWSKSVQIPSNYDCPLEISNPMVILRDNRWLAPMTLLTDKDHLGEKVIVRESRDEGLSWGNEYTVFADKAGRKGFFEKKIIQMEPGKLIAFAWTVEMGTYKDFTNHFTFSNDGGRSWSEPCPTPISGQTLTPLWMGGSQFLLIYNYRKPPQGIKLALANIDGRDCKVVDDAYLWQPAARNENSVKKGIDSFDDFAFGLPSVVHLDNENFLSVFWSLENGVSCIKGVRFQTKIKGAPEK